MFLLDDIAGPARSLVMSYLTNKTESVNYNDVIIGLVDVALILTEIPSSLFYLILKFVCFSP